MPEFGYKDICASFGYTAAGINTRMRQTKITLPENGLVSKLTIYLLVNAGPTGEQGEAKAIIYDTLDGNTPNALVGISQPSTFVKADGEPHWEDLNFSPVLSLPAGDYFCGMVCKIGAGYGGYYQIEFSCGPERYGYEVTGPGTEWYDVAPPDLWPDGGALWDTRQLVYGTYEPSAQAYPTSRLKKGLTSGYHCFLGAYILASIQGYTPLKNPDGTPF